MERVEELHAGPTYVFATLKNPEITEELVATVRCNSPIKGILVHESPLVPLCRIVDLKMDIENEVSSVPIDETAHIVAAYVSNNRVAPADLPALIASVFEALVGASSPTPKVVEPEPQTPAVSIKKSVTDDYIVCLEDGKSFKSLKRHLMTHYDLTPEQYRTKWKLPADYPMVAPNYAAARSALAKSMGLGRKPAAEMPAPPAEPSEKPAKARAPRKVKEAAE